MARIATIFGVLLFLSLMMTFVREQDATRAELQVAANDRAVPNDVRAFGAKGDGKTDDADAIQRAISASRGGVWFPPGTYRLGKPIVIELDKVGYAALRGDGSARIVMAAAGAAFRFVGTHRKSARPDEVAGNVWERQRMPVVDGLAIEGDHPESLGIEATGVMQLTITRAHVRKVLHAIHLIGANRNVIIAECHLYENRGAGVLFDDVNLHQSTIGNCHISYNAGGGIVTRRGHVRNLHITGCDIENNMSPTGPATANVLLDSREGAMGTAEVAITGCTIQHEHKSKGSANIAIFGRSGPPDAKQPTREGHITITGNVLSDIPVNIHLQECRGVTIVGNTFWQGYDYDLLIEKCSSVVVGPNNFDRNPRYEYVGGADARHGILFRDCDDCTLQGLHVTNVRRQPAAIEIDSCQRFLIDGCSILDCDACGLLLKNVSRSRVANCLIRNDLPEAKFTPVRVEGGGDNAIEAGLIQGR